MTKERQITPLALFPTEALVMNYRRHRVCRTKHFGTVEIVFNQHTCKYEYWEEFTGPYEIDGVIYNPCVIGYTKLTTEEFHKKYTEIKGDIWTYGKYDNYFQYTDEMEFTFEGMYWRGTINEIKKELAKRPHVSLKGGKDFRRWKIKYKKSIKN